jgi:hypothetical protein
MDKIILKKPTKVKEDGSYDIEGEIVTNKSGNVILKGSDGSEYSNKVGDINSDEKYNIYDLNFNVKLSHNTVLYQAIFLDTKSNIIHLNYVPYDKITDQNSLKTTPKEKYTYQNSLKTTPIETTPIEKYTNQNYNNLNNSYAQQKKYTL